MTRRIVIYVQHLMGIGHVMRASAIAKALSNRGTSVLLIMGGAPLDSIDCGEARIAYLPPAKAASFPETGIVDLDGSALTATWFAERKQQLFQRVSAFEPHLILTEQYPFGRRAFEFELAPLLSWARSQGIKIVGSVRDILVAKKKSRRNEEMADKAREFFDLILVHGDKDIIPFDLTFPTAERIRDLIRYTGYVNHQRGLESEDGMGEVIVSAGGGRYGDRLYKTALAARPLSTLHDVTWRFLVGANASPRTLDQLHDSNQRGVVIEPAREDFQGLLRNARLSISQAGYNTVLDVLAARVPSVMIPYVGDEETEQTLRAQHLADRDAVVLMNENELTPDTMCLAIDSALVRNSRDVLTPRMDGAEVSADILCGVIDDAQV